MAVLAGGLVSEFIPDWLIKTIAALAFLYFAASTISGDDDEKRKRRRQIQNSVRTARRFLYVLRSRARRQTQLTAITFGANEGMGSAFVVWIGCSLGLFAADILGMLVGYLLKSKTPDGLLNTLAFVIFSIFGVYTLPGTETDQRRRLSTTGMAVLIAATAVLLYVSVFL